MMRDCMTTQHKLSWSQRVKNKVDDQSMCVTVALITSLSQFVLDSEVLNKSKNLGRNIDNKKVQILR
jgi:hypothetical protein